jgi:hypothetical protein
MQAGRKDTHTAAEYGDVQRWREKLFNNKLLNTG